MTRYRLLLYASRLARRGGRPVLARSPGKPGAIGYGRRSSGSTAPTRGGFRPSPIVSEGFGRPGWTDGEEASMGAGSRAGARGLKVHKSLCLGRDVEGKLIVVDGPRIDPLWEFCGRLGRPVVIHTGDPRAFFAPADRHDERLRELGEHPEWAYHGRGRTSGKGIYITV